MVLMLASAVMLCFTSCLNEATDPNSGEGQLPANVATLSEQVAAMKSSVAALETLQVTLSETAELQSAAAQIESCATSVKEHIASIEAGMSGVNAAIAAMKLQKEIANVTGALKVTIAPLVNRETLLSDILSLESSVAAWLGKEFKNYFAVSAEQARLSSMLSLVKSQSYAVDAITSDVEAGLRVGDSSGLKEVAATVERNSKTLSQLNANMSALSSEVEKGYTNAIKSANSSKSALKALNTKAAAALADSVESLDDLLALINECKDGIAAIEERLEELEATVEELLGMIQSVTFMSKYVEDKACPYYNMNINEKVSDTKLPYNGKAVRTATGELELDFIVRPAAAAKALNANLSAVSLMGYYANSIQTKAPLASDYFNSEEMKVTDVVVNENDTRGLVTITVEPRLRDAFYYKEIGARCALSIKSGKADVTSKFFELQPKENSTRVYVQSVVPSKTLISIKQGEYAELTATINPEGVSTPGYYLLSKDTRYVRINEETGQLYAHGEGTATVEVWSRGTDEWGLPVMATCTVKVEAAFVVAGPPFVEVGYDAQMFLTYPSDAIVRTKVWSTSDPNKLTVDESGKVRGIAHTYSTTTKSYSEITVYCLVNDVYKPSAKIKVAAIQPQDIITPAVSAGQTEVSMRVDESLSLASTIYPENVPEGAYTLKYQSDPSGFIDFRSGIVNEAKKPLSPQNIYVYITADNYDQEKYLTTDPLKKTLIVKILPYYIKNLILPETLTLAPDADATLTPEFISDVDGKQPTIKTLEWTSSDPSIVEVDSATGHIIAKGEGSAMITATTLDGATVSSEKLSASCIVTVKKPVAEVKVGDYFYSDGTWSTDLKSDKTVVGIVFANINPVASDVRLLADYPNCTNGLVLSTQEYARAFGEYSYSTSVPAGIANHLAPVSLSQTLANGYGLTKAYAAYRDKYKGESGRESYCLMFDNTTGLPATHNNACPAPDNASEWYVPSYYEMVLMYNSKDVINAAIERVGGNKLENKKYIHATLWTSRWDGRSYDDCSSYYFDMSSGKWNGTYLKGSALPVRVVFAF